MSISDLRIYIYRTSTLSSKSSGDDVSFHVWDTRGSTLQVAAEWVTAEIPMCVQYYWNRKLWQTRRVAEYGVSSLSMSRVEARVENMYHSSGYSYGSHAPDRECMETGYMKKVVTRRDRYRAKQKSALSKGWPPRDREMESRRNGLNSALGCFPVRLASTLPPVTLPWALSFGPSSLSDVTQSGYPPKEESTFSSCLLARGEFAKVESHAARVGER